MRGTALALMLVVSVASVAGATEVWTGQPADLRILPSEMMVVPSGTFLMGVDLLELNDLRMSCRQEHYGMTTDVCERDEFFIKLVGRAREVYLSTFAIDRVEVSVAAYRRCVDTGVCDRLPLVSGDTRNLRDELPMANVTWQEAVDYCRWAGKRLPTEAEWEKAARGIDGRRWPWGMADGDGRANRGKTAPPVVWPYNRTLTAWFPDYVPDDRDGSAAPVPPGTLRWGRSPYDVEDMAGNVAEWVQDWFADAGYAGLSSINPLNGTPGRFRWRVVRGGAYDDPHFLTRTYVRQVSEPESRSPSRGFRCARDVL